MRTFSADELKIIIEKHNHWLNNDCVGCENMRADLSYADLTNADLSCVDLTNADLSYANLSYADLTSANLTNVNLSYADLTSANLTSANLNYATLASTNLTNVNLSYADLTNADLNYANLLNADLTYADLTNADLTNAKLMTAKLNTYIPMICPEEGSFIGWKKAEVLDEGIKYDVIVKLSIPADAKRSSATTRKCRCDKAMVLEIYDLSGSISKERKCHSKFMPNFIYEVGKTVRVNDFNNNRWYEGTSGIHFFINRQEAINFTL